MSEITINHESSEPDKALREEFNRRLKEKMGVDTVTGLQMWRVSWAPDQYNKVLANFKDFSPSGILIREVREVREVPKYPHLNAIYILELLMGVPSVNSEMLPTGKLTYECMHPYMHVINGTYLPPHWTLTEWVIDCYESARGRSSLKRYLDPDADGNNGLDSAKIRYAKIIEGLYGNHTNVTDALHDKTGVFVDSTKRLI